MVKDIVIQADWHTIMVSKRKPFKKLFSMNKTKKDAVNKVGRNSIKENKHFS